MIRRCWPILLVVASSSYAEDRLFHLEDLADKINGGMTATKYCEEKANISLSQAKASNAPIEAQKQIKYWVALACSLDIVAEAKRIDANKTVK